MEKAITNRIKTYFTLYLGKEADGELPKNAELLPLRIDLGGTNVAGTTEEIESDIILPESRIPSTPETGSESNSGDVPTEWNIDEQDDLFAGAFCGEWEQDDGNPNRKTLTLGDEIKAFTLLKYYSQKPVAWQWFRREFVNQLTMDFATDSFVKLTWNFMGSNNPKKVFSDPLADLSPVYRESLKTKSFLTKKGFIKIGDRIESLVPVRQAPSMNVTINNNLERTPALFEEESIENSLGNFDVTGTIDIYNVDDMGHDLYNDAVDGKDKVIQVRVERTVAGVTTSYTLTMDVHLGAPSESRNGNKLQFSVPFTLNDDKNFSLVKEVSGASVADTPAFVTTLADVSYGVGDAADPLDGSASVGDGGTVTYSWKDGDGTEVGTSATYTPSTASAGETVLTVTATNTLGGLTATASQTVAVTVTE